MLENQTLDQKKIELAQGGYEEAIIGLMKDCIENKPIIGKTQWETIVNSITLDVQSTMLRGMVDRLNNIREGAIHREIGEK